MFCYRNTLGRWAVLLLAALGLVTGCRTTKGPGSDSLAKVTIKGVSAFEVARAASDVMEKAGFTPVPLDSNKEMKLLFEKEAGKGADLIYGDWGPGKVYYRARLRISTLAPETQLLTCDAFRVLDHNDPHFERQQRLSRAHKGRYQGLLNQIQKQLQSPP